MKTMQIEGYNFRDYDPDTKARATNRIAMAFTIDEVLNVSGQKVPRLSITFPPPIATVVYFAGSPAAVVEALRILTGPERIQLDDGWNVVVPFFNRITAELCAHRFIEVGYSIVLHRVEGGQVVEIVDEPSPPPPPPPPPPSNPEVT